MKKLTVSLAVMGMASLGFAQSSYSQLDQPWVMDFGTLASNYEYLNEVQNSLTPNYVKYLENVVSYWDVTKSKKFDGRERPFEVTFKSGRGSIVASYGNEGEILTSLERFNDIALPKQVGASIQKMHPGCEVLKTSYTLFYNKATGTKKHFKVQIQKDGQREWLRIDPSGAII